MVPRAPQSIHQSLSSLFAKRTTPAFSRVSGPMTLALTARSSAQQQPSSSFRDVRNAWHPGVQIVAEHKSWPCTFSSSPSTDESSIGETVVKKEAR